MITAIVAPPGTGKSALATAIAVNNMRGKQARDRVRACKKFLEPLNANGFHLQLPEDCKHLVFADYPISCRHGQLVSWEMNGFEFGLPNKQHKTKFIPPCSILIFDECQKYLNSRAWQKFADFVSRAYEQHRHWGLDIYLVLQRLGLIDVNVRDLLGRVMEVKGMKHVYRDGFLTKTVWGLRVWDNAASAARAFGGSKITDKGEKQKYVFEGNIFKCYNQTNFFPYFLRDRYDRTGFDMLPSFICSPTLQDVKLFNRIYSYETPDTFGKR